MSIEVRNLTFSYDGNNKVLDDVSFSIDNGQMVCLLGPNGVGKTTLFKIILNILGGYEGSVFIDGEETKDLSRIQMARKVAYIPQSQAPTFNFSVEDMVLMGTTSQLASYRRPGAKQREIVLSVMEELGISYLKDRGFSKISGGEKQLVLIARALAQQTGTLVMDEPTANLDYGNAMIVLEKISELADRGYTILQATHQPDHAFLFADSVLALKGGRVAYQGKPEDTITSDLIHDLYGIEADVRSIGDDGVKVCVPIFASKNREPSAGYEKRIRK